MTFLIEIIKLGLTNLRLHLLRSFLTALGIIFGVAAVISMVAIGEGTTREALAQIERLGARNIIVRSQKPPESNTQGGNRRSFLVSYGLTRNDMRVIRENMEDAEAIVPIKAIGSEIVHEQYRQVSQAFGTTPDLLGVARLRIAKGRYLLDADMAEQSPVCVIGSEVAKQLFPQSDPLNQTLRIDDKALTVVGVLAPVGLAGGAGTSLIGRDFNLDVHVPMSMADSVFGDVVVRRQSGSFSGQEVQISEVYVLAPDRERVLTDASRIQRIMETRHPGLTDIQMIVPFELLEEAQRRARTGRWVSGMIAGISLLVGGIGIMNIMLANVTERTKEIGIRRALGATRANIIVQFLVETSVLSMAGGIIGILLGVSVSVALDTVVPMLPRTPFIGSYFSTDVNMPTHVTGWSVMTAFLIASATGLIFGLYPARRAAMQDPIVALRHD